MLVTLQRILVLLSFMLITACGGGGSSTEQDLEPQLFISGAGIKGPLAFASVELYALDMGFEQFYEPGNPIAAATTNAYAQITGLPVPRDIAPPYVLVIDGTNAIDRNTGVAPIIKKLVTIITKEALDSRQPVFATPYTTLAYHMLIGSSTSTSRVSGPGPTITQVDLTGNVPEEASTTINISIPAGAVSGVITLTAYDADFPDEGELVINGNAPVALFGTSGVRNNNGKSTDIAIRTPASYWNNGDNTLLFRHTGSRQGYIIDAVSVSFETQAPVGSITAALAEFNTRIIQSVGFGISEEIDIFTTPPIITANTTSIEQQALVVNYRAAIEALSSLLHEMFLSSSDGITTDGLLQLFALDLQSDGVINGKINGQAFSNIDMGILSQDPMTLEMPNTQYLVRDILSLIDEERALIGASTNTILLKDDISVNLQPASLISTGSSHLNSTVENPPQTSYHSPVGNLASTLLASGLIASGPLVIDGESDVVIRGLHISNPDGSCLVVRNASANIVIKDSEIGPCKDEGIYIESSENITIRDTYIHDTKGVGIRTFSAERIHVTSNQIERVASGVLAGKSKQVDINNNYFLNVQGPYPRGQIVQFVRVSGPGNRINNNIGINEVGKSYAEDTINIYSSHGTPDDYIQVNDNILVGGGPSRSGGGILLGDNDSSYAIADGNILVNPGATGIKIASGHHLILTNNKVFSDRKDFTNTAVPIGNQAKNREEFGCHSLEVSNNEITFWKGTEFLKDGQTEPFLSPYWKWGGCGTITGWETNKFDTPNNQPANLDESILPADLIAVL